MNIILLYLNNIIVHILKVDQRLDSLFAHLVKSEYNIIVQNYIIIVHILKVDQRLVSLWAHLVKSEYNIIVHEQ